MAEAVFFQSNFSIMALIVAIAEDNSFLLKAILEKRYFARHLNQDSRYQRN
jgi:hypothetical protein